MKNPAEIAKSYVEIGKKKCELSVLKMLVLGIFAGVFIAFAGCASTFTSVYANKFFGAFIFSSGLAMVLVAGSELFTGNSLIIISVLERKVSLMKMLKNWLIVYLGNLIGSLFVAALAAFSGGIDGVAEAALSTAAAKSNMTFGGALMEGILCNILVCIAVWMSFAADSVSGKIMAVIFPITVFVVCGFEHSIANMYFIPAGLFIGLKEGVSFEGLNFVNMVFNNLLPVTIGNVIGGGAFVGLGYWLSYLKGNKN